MTKPTDTRGGTTIVWFRDDLRMADNAALRAAADRKSPLVALFVLDEESDGIRPLGGARRWWLHHSLESLSESLAEAGGRLILRRGKAAEVLGAVVRETGADAVYWNRRYDPPAVAVDIAIKEHLTTDGLDVRSFEGRLLHEPSIVKTGSGGPYRIYTPFWRALESGVEPRSPLPAVRSIASPRNAPQSDELSDWHLLPAGPDWSGGMAEVWEPGERAALRRLAEYLDGDIEGYAENRDRPAMALGTSRLSPYLAFGELSPFQVWHATRGLPRSVSGTDLATFRKELVWREFCYHLLFHFPKLPIANYNERFDGFPWKESRKALRAWQKGQTGYPIVDAGMRQLWQTGWMHNRVRMIVASFLTKHLLIDWRQGEAWFWDTLVDGDPASNAANWQWVAGSGADAAPYFRIFNPILQGEKFDPDGAYVRAFVPEIAGLDDKYIHKPWQAPAEMLRKARISLGETYPKPIVDHKEARSRALAAYDDIKDAA